MIAARPQGGVGGGSPVPATRQPLLGGPDAITAPVDAVHAVCVEALRRVRSDFAAARLRVARWQPTPYPGSAL